MADLAGHPQPPRFAPSGVVSFGKETKGKRRIVVTPETGEVQEYLIPEERLVDEVQEVYRLQGVKINDKHIEVIVRQMLRRVRVRIVGDSDFLVDEPVEKYRFDEANERLTGQNLRPALSEPLLLGITKASLSTDSFLSAASFQETTRVLTDAAIRGAKDDLLGLKENIIIGHLIPAGSGIYRYAEIDIEPPAGYEPPPPPEPGTEPAAQPVSVAALMADDEE